MAHMDDGCGNDMRHSVVNARPMDRIMAAPRLMNHDKGE